MVFRGPLQDPEVQIPKPPGARIGRSNRQVTWTVTTRRLSESSPELGACEVAAQPAEPSDLPRPESLLPRLKLRYDADRDMFIQKENSQVGLDTLEFGAPMSAECWCGIPF